MLTCAAQLLIAMVGALHSLPTHTSPLAMNFGIDTV